MSASRVIDQFMISLAVQVDAAITLVDVTVGLRPGFVSIWRWYVLFSYVTGAPAATAFRLSSSSIDELEGTFSPAAPVGIGSGIKSATCVGTVQRLPGVESDRTYRGTITVIQE